MNDTNNPLALLDKAISSGMDPDKLGKLMDLAERWNAEQRFAAYSRALAACQAEMPAAICRNATNPETRKAFATYDALNSKIKPIYTKHGFSVVFGSEPAPPFLRGRGVAADGTTTTETYEERVRIFADLMHEDGHRERRFIDLAVDMYGPKGQPNKTQVQGMGSTTSYGRRYLLKNLFNLAEEDEDNDGRGNTGFITGDQVQLLNEALIEYRELCNTTDDGWEKWRNGWLAIWEVANIGELDQVRFTKAAADLQRRIKEKKVKK